MNLIQRISLIEEKPEMLNQWAVSLHYLHRAVHYRSSPFGYLVEFDGKSMMPDGLPCGFIIFASVHFTKQRRLFGYDGLPTKWQVLSLARLWLHDSLPKNSETVVISKTLQPKGPFRISRVGLDWLRVHPPRYPDKPYHIRLIISYADNNMGHVGTVYKAANFEALLRCEHCEETFYSISKPTVNCPHCGQKTPWKPKEIISRPRHKGCQSVCKNHVLTQYIYRLPEPRLTLSEIKDYQLFLPQFCA